MKRILFVGDHPLNQSGNGHMMRSILGTLDTEKYAPACFAIESKLIKTDIFVPMPLRIISSTEVMENGKVDGLGRNKLLEVLSTTPVDALVMVGIDIWLYAGIFDQIKKIRDKKHFVWIAIFPYDLQNVRKDWVGWIKELDVPCVYSQYGRDLLKDHVPNIQYFRPPLLMSDDFIPFEEDQRRRERSKYFPMLKEDQFVFGFVGKNQIRKDPQTLLKAFSILKKKYPSKVVLYFHTDFDSGVYNLKQSAVDFDLEKGELVAKRPGDWYSHKQMAQVYNSLDCLVNCSMQEGLSWTLVEAMCCGVPIIASDTTAQTELVKDVGKLVECEAASFLPIITASGQSHIEVKSCRAEDIAEAMGEVLDSDLEFYRKRSKAKSKEWLEGVSSINELLDEFVTPKKFDVVRKENRVLFAQHSSAGDVFMTTRCLKGIKERFKLPIDYMTSEVYMDIIEGNEYVDNVIPWDEAKLKSYQVVVNPHGEVIAPGHWGRNCNSILSDFYWKILRVDPDDFMIRKWAPKKEIAEEIIERMENPICIVHTTGGDVHFRTYKYMGDICKELKNRYFTVQVGSGSDYPAWAKLDLRGKLSFSETAWVMDKASLAITVDSFVSHLAGALGISQVCLFGSGNAMVVRPNQVIGTLICRSPDYVNDCPGLGPCSATVRDCFAPCTGKHNPKSILQDIEYLEFEGKVRRNYEYKEIGGSVEYVSGD